MTQHTPGPWAVEIPFQEKGLYVTAANPRKTNPLICRLSPLEEQEANARLIAAAPKMLEVLESIHANAAESPEWIRARIESVLLAARGPVTHPREFASDFTLPEDPSTPA